MPMELNNSYKILYYYIAHFIERLQTVQLNLLIFVWCNPQQVNIQVNFNLCMKNRPSVEINHFSWK